MVRKRMLVRQDPQIQLVVIYLQKLSETQLKPGARKPQMRWVSLGFLFGVASLVRVGCCVSFQRFGGIRSTQPTGRYGYF